jgi:hypothetical protein
MLSFSGGITKKDIVFQNFMKEYNFFQFDQKFVNMLHKVQKGISFYWLTDLFEGFQRFEMDFLSIFNA